MSVCWSSAIVSLKSAGSVPPLTPPQPPSRQEKLATSEMFERETRREKILEAIDLNREMQLRQNNKTDVFHLLVGGKQKHRSSNTERETAQAPPKVDPLEEAEKEFYRIVKEVKIFHLKNEISKNLFDVIKYCIHN